MNQDTHEPTQHQNCNDSKQYPRKILPFSYVIRLRLNLVVIAFISVPHQKNLLRESNDLLDCNMILKLLFIELGQNEMRYIQVRFALRSSLPIISDFLCILETLSVFDTFSIQDHLESKIIRHKSQI